MSGDDQFTKREMEAMLETQKKATEQMVIVANSLNSILTTQKDILERLEACEVCKNKLPVIATDTHGTADDIKHVKWFIGATGLVLLVAEVILRLVIKV